MATRTSVGSGNWSAPETWDTGVPIDGDDVVIASGHTVTFDVDQSDFTIGVKITITGTLNHALTGGPYTMFLKTGASLVGAGTWNVGTEANPIPFAVKHTITGASDWYADGTSGLTITVYAAEPTTKYVKLSDTEAIGQTVLEVDTDVTGDIWAEGDTIHINNVNKGSQSESRTIAAGGIAAGAITVTAGLTAAKLAGSYVLLMSRNVKFIAVGNQKIFNAITGATIAGGEFVATKYLITSSATTTISGGTFRGATTYGGIYSCTDFTISGGVYSSNAYSIVAGSGHIISGGVYSGNANGVVYSLTGVTIEDGIFAGNSSVLSSVMAPTILDGTFYGNQYVINAVRGGIVFGGTYENNTSVIYESSVECNNIISTNNTQDIYRSLVAAYNCSFGSTTEFTGYNILPKETFSYSINHDQVAGAYKAWTKGGVTTKQAVTYPTGFTNSMQTVLESTTSEGYWQKELSVGAGQSVNITSYLRKDASMTYLPRVIMFLKNTTDPFAGGTGLHTFTMTDSVDTWEDDTYTYSNDTSEDVVLVIRTQGKNATGNLFSYLDIEVINVDLTSVIALLNTIDGKADTIDAIKAKTDLIPASPAEAGEYTTAIAALQTDLDNPDQYKADVSGIPAAVWGYATRTLSSFGTLISDIWAHATRTLSAFGFTVATQSDANVTAIKAKTDNLPAIPAPANEYDAELAAIQADLDNPNQYKADVSNLATTAHVQEVEDKVDAIKLKTDNIPANPATAGEYTASLAAIQADVSGIPDAILAKVIVDTLTVEQVLKVLAAVETGVTTGGGTDTIVYTGKDGTTIQLTGVDLDGNRTAVIVTPGA
jgi:hypothetical protein